MKNIPCENIEDKLVGFAQGDLAQVDAEYIQKHVENCERCQKELIEVREVIATMELVPIFQPAQELEANFSKMLELEKKLTSEGEIKSSHTKIRTLWSMPLIQVAASIAILAMGIWIGMQIQSPWNQTEVTALKNDLDDMKQLVMLSMLEKSSASERIKAVYSVSEFTTPAPQVLQALIKTLNEDHNVNVRLAAISAISRFSTNNEVRKNVIDALGQQDDAIVQIALINLLVSWEEKKASQALKDLTEKEGTLEVVKEQAEKGLQLLM